MKKLLFLLVLLLSGCASVADIRSMTPDQSLESNTHPKQIADSVMYRAPEEINSFNFHHNFSLMEAPPGSYHVRVDSPFSSLGEADFLPNGQGGTRIELRTAWNFGKKDAFWACIQRCASPQNSPGK